MPHIFNETTTQFLLKQSPVPEFCWHTSPKLSEIVNAKNLHLDIRSLDPDKFSYPYHFHRNSEELFVILSGEVTLRADNEFKVLHQGDIVFFESGPAGAHQLYNHSLKPCRYLDIRTNTGIDICEYPDSGKINITPYREIYESESKVDYYKDEEKVKEHWPDSIVKR
jgi:uncharacterized cupin superfamily protein